METYFRCAAHKKPSSLLRTDRQRLCSIGTLPRGGGGSGALRGPAQGHAQHDSLASPVLPSSQEEGTFVISTLWMGKLEITPISDSLQIKRLLTNSTPSEHRIIMQPDLRRLREPSE